MNYRTLANYLAHRYADMREETDSRAENSRRHAAFTAACGTAHATGIGMTPSHVWGIVQETIEGVGDRPLGGAFPTARKAWDAEATEELAHALQAI